MPASAQRLSSFPSSPAVRVVLADDHALLRGSLRRLLEEAGLQVVGEAQDGAEAVLQVQKLCPDLLLLDLSMPKASGMDALFELSHCESPVKVLFLTAEIDFDEIVKALYLGACGIVLKVSPPEVLITAIRTVAAGDYWFDSHPVKDIEEYRQKLAVRNPQLQPCEKKPFGLTPRELQVVAGVVAVLSNKEIACRFGIAENTVKNHLTKCNDKTGTSNRLELALFALHHKLRLPPIE
jgi:two-component system, NarL family, nitrate/nitrite response regulator NarL